MQFEQIKDILDWTREYHSQMSRYYEQCASQSDSKRITLLLQCLADHQRTLADTINRYEEIADAKALNTWCYEYLDKNPIMAQTLDQTNLQELTVEQIVIKTIKMHTQLIAFYQHLAGRGGTAKIRDLFNGLVQLEQHEALDMAHDAKRIEAQR